MPEKPKGIEKLIKKLQAVPESGARRERTLSLPNLMNINSAGRFLHAKQHGVGFQTTAENLALIYNLSSREDLEMALRLSASKGLVWEAEKDGGYVLKAINFKEK